MPLTITDSKTGAADLLEAKKPIRAVGKGGVETNEVDRNSMGGTELMKYGLHERLPGELLDNFQIICSRVREIDPKRIPILWCHDLAGDTEVSHLKNVSAEDTKFAKLVFVSHWQLQQYRDYLGVPYSKCAVLQNAITPIPDHEKPNDVINLCYFTTPHRGLEILVPVFKHLHENNFKEISKPVHLHIHSSYEVYGWKQRDDQFKELFDQCLELPNVHYYGYTKHDDLLKEIEKYHILAFPSVWPETSCLQLLEAMSAKMLCVHSSLAGLPETAANWTLMYPMDEDMNRHANVFADMLFSGVRAIDTGYINDRLEMQKRYIDGFYNWDVRAMQWNQMLTSILEQGFEHK